MYVSGIVRASNQVRKRLQHGIGRHEIEMFRSRVLTTVEQVEKICRQHGVSPGALPLPSRNAYKFLKELDLERLPVVEDAVEVAPARVHLSNVLRTANQFHGQFWQELDSLNQSVVHRDEMLTRIIYMTDGIEAVCRDRGSTPAAMEQPSLQAYTWMKFLTDKENFADHIDALVTARGIAIEKALNVSIELTNMRSLWRYNKKATVYAFKIHQGFVHAPIEVWKALLTLRLGDCTRANSLVREFAHSDQFSEISFALETLVAESKPKARGRVHDLDASFERVNATYFDGKIKRPILTWNKVVTARKFGHYDRLRDTVMLSISLDHESVPEFVVDSVMHHELLHKQHGTMFVNGKRISHNAEFRRQERLFLQFSEADKMISMLARKYRI